MSENEFSRIAESLWGYGWQTKAAKHFEVADRTVRRWVAGTEPPAKIIEALRAMVSIAPAPCSDGDEDRDEACRMAIEPEITRVRDLAIAAGWHPAEVATAILALTVDEIRSAAGDDAAREVLSLAAESIRATRRRPSK